MSRDQDDTEGQVPPPERAAPADRESPAELAAQGAESAAATESASELPPQLVADPVARTEAHQGTGQGSGTGTATDGADETGLQRLRAALWPPRVSRAQLVVALLLFSLGLGLAIQVRSTNSDTQLRGARQDDLVRVLDEVNARQQRLESERQQLQQSLAALQSTSQQAKEAAIQTLTKEQQLGVLAGSVGATGPGIVLTVKDPGGKVQADMLLNTLEELRAAGAEAVQINSVRVVADTWFSDATPGAVVIGGKTVSQPYQFTVIGNSHDLDVALGIPGGVVQSVQKLHGTATVVEQKSLAVTALVPLSAPANAEPAQP